jgi:hypothetical protein
MTSELNGNILEKTFKRSKSFEEEIERIQTTFEKSRDEDDEDAARERTFQWQAFIELQEVIVKAHERRLRNVEDATLALERVRVLLRPEQQHWIDEAEQRSDGQGGVRIVPLHSFRSMTHDEKLFWHVALVGVAMEWHISEWSVRHSVP